MFRNRRRLSGGRKERDHASPSRLHVGIVLQIFGRQPFVGLVPVIRFQQVFFDVIRGLFVAVELLVLAVEQSVRIRSAHHRFLRVNRRGGKQGGKQSCKCELNFHGYYV